jgi:hypothetical protein
MFLKLEITSNVEEVVEIKVIPLKIVAGFNAVPVE